MRICQNFCDREKIRDLKYVLCNLYRWSEFSISYTSLHLHTHETLMELMISVWQSSVRRFLIFKFGSRTRKYSAWDDLFHAVSSDVGRSNIEIVRKLIACRTRRPFTAANSICPLTSSYYFCVLLLISGLFNSGNGNRDVWSGEPYLSRISRRVVKCCIVQPSDTVAHFRISRSIT